VDQEIILEARRNGRRPRYHRGALQRGTGVRLDPPQCNLDDVGLEVRQLEALPEYPAMPRPWAQLCRRCFRGTDVLGRADSLRPLEALQ
jgi:hypothetical protein